MEGFVVSRPFPDSNVGSNLSSLAGAAWFARRLDRPMIVDWRGLSQLRDPSVNYFTEFFERPNELLGAPVLYAPIAEVGEYDEGSDAARITPDEARALALGDAPLPSRHVVLHSYHGLDRLHPGPDTERIRLLRSFYRQIHPVRRISDLVDDWWQREYDGELVIGVNVRTGNGHYFGKGQRYVGRVDIRVFENEKRFLRVIERAVRKRARAAAKDSHRSFRVFYATDSGRMSELLANLPNAAARREIFPPPGAGDTYAFGEEGSSDREAVVDTVADMFLLARCDALVYNSSLFNQYARVLTGNFSGNQVHIESLFLRTRARAITSSLRRRL